MIKTYPLKEIVKYAAENSPYYKELYSNVDLENFELCNLPTVDQEQFWKAADRKENRLLTGPMHDGVIFKSGGTTGKPKFSIFTKDEWESFTRLFGEGMDQNALEEDDKVANLFYAGELYASFVFIMKSLEFAKTPALHFPISGSITMEQLVKTVNEFEINVLCGVPTTFVNLASYLQETGQKISVSKILYGGESLYDDQKLVIENAIPGVECHSVGYASVDAGHLGYVSKDCSVREHRVFDGSIVEILDTETGEVIVEKGRVGKLVYTNLTRKLMPIIRYPAGDEAAWTDEGKFILLGRSEEGARVGPVTVNRDDIVNILAKVDLQNKVSNFQMVIDRETGKDRLTVRLGTTPHLLDTMGQNLGKLKSVLASERPMLIEAAELGHIENVQFEFCTDFDLLKNERTGKLREVIDNRLSNSVT